MTVASPGIHQKRQVVVLREGPLGIKRDESATRQMTPAISVVSMGLLVESLLV